MTGRAAVSGGLALLCAGLLGAAASPAHAESAYRYWSFWLNESNAWTYAQQGPATIAVTDGDIFGWRFGIARESDASAPAPELDPDRAWQDACGEVPEGEDTARVAVVIDFGQPQDAPDGEVPPESVLECAVVPEGTSGAQALSTVVDIRSESGLICAFDGYPAGECAPSIEVADASSAESSPAEVVTPDHGASTAPEVADAVASEETTSESGNLMLTLIVAGIAVLLVFVGIALFATRRSKEQPR